MSENPTYYSILPASVRYNKNLKANEKLLFSEITALTNKDGVCYATNEYFAKLYGVTKVAISQWISNLEKQKLIDREIIYADGSKQILNRYIRIVIDPIKQNFNTPIKQNFKDTIYNNTSNEYYKINNIGGQAPQTTKTNFKKPTLEEVKAYCIERKNSVDAQRFIDFYESKGWMVGKNKMKDWKASVRTWESKDKSKAVVGSQAQFTEKEISKYARR